MFSQKKISTAENCMQKWIILSNRCTFLWLGIICVPPIIIDRWIQHKCSCFDSDNLLRFTKMVNCLPEYEYFNVFLKNKNIIFKFRRSKVTDYAALTDRLRAKKGPAPPPPPP